MVKDDRHIILTWNLPDQRSGGAVITVLQPHDVFHPCGLQKSLVIYSTDCNKLEKQEKRKICNTGNRKDCIPDESATAGTATWIYGYVEQGTKTPKQVFYGWVLKEIKGVPQVVQTT
jgi:hypothetical protein